MLYIKKNLKPMFEGTDVNPTAKDRALVKKLAQIYSIGHGTFVDLTAGTGSLTGYAAVELGCPNVVLFESDPKQVKYLIHTFDNIKVDKIPKSQHQPDYGKPPAEVAEKDSKVQ